MTNLPQYQASSKIHKKKKEKEKSKEIKRNEKHAIKSNQISAGEPICTMQWHHSSFLSAIKREFVRYFMKQLPEVFCKKDALKDFANFTEKYLCWSLFLMKLPA